MSRAESCSDLGEGLDRSARHGGEVLLETGEQALHGQVEQCRQVVSGPLRLIAVSGLLAPQDEFDGVVGFLDIGFNGHVRHHVLSRVSPLRLDPVPNSCRVVCLKSLGRRAISI
ncbi:hypothetical protein [Pseudonocardia alni]|uniref:hypothetical protein n=1 Tax=Pseudonocardia alni TaxID=33907 RepID=UPI00280B4750|nr:hypothetical protein [Pseudonocardia alni]